LLSCAGAVPSPHITQRRTFSALLTLAAAGAVCFFASPGIHGQRHRARLSLDLLKFESSSRPGHARVIVRGARSKIEALASRHGVSVAKWLSDSAVLIANRQQLSALAADDLNDVLSGDVPVGPFMGVSNASTAADQTRTGTSGLLLGIGGVPGVTGQGVTIAVIDSGITAHPALVGKIVANKSFVTGDPLVTDAFGHGTHIAGTIVGNGSAASGVTNQYTGGIAPGAKLVNVRVLGKNGSGWTSDVIAGIEWTIENRELHKIRIINLSLGHPVVEPCAIDPLCQAVMKATASGLIVVASAGNSGKSASGAPILGGISSPGNSPYAITVGAVNTKATIARNDDVMATYSSRGPTRFEFVVKPDVVAPGNKVVSLEAPGSYLANANPHLRVAGRPSTNGYMHMSGTSMSTAVVSGGAALLLQADPKMSASQLKTALQSGATFMTDGGLMGGGAGSVNFWSSRRTAGAGLTSLVNTLVAGLLVRPSGVVFWDTGKLSTRVYHRTGIRLLSLLEAPLAWLTPGYLKWNDLNLIGLSNPLSTTRSNEILWGDVASWTSDHEILWGDTIYDPEGHEILWGDSSVSEGDEILWGDTIEADSN
jgi:serine protease AprX